MRNQANPVTYRIYCAHYGLNESDPKCKNEYITYLEHVEAVTKEAKESGKREIPDIELH
ncbi:MAG: hypothetical protein V7782_09470 [Psychromonas sp.]